MKFLAALLSIMALAVGLVYALFCYLVGMMGGWDE